MTVIDSPYIVAANCRHGPLMFNKHEHIMAYALAIFGEFAEDELERLARYLKPGMTVIDVGANIGTHATAFAKMVSPGRVYAIEPHLCNFNILAGNIALRGTQNAYPIRAMAGTADRMHLLAQIDATQGANFGALTALDRVSEGHGFPTPEMRVDSLGLSACNLIKVDVEGHELEVLTGATETIDKYGPVILAECNEKANEADSLATFERIAPFFRAHGYSMFWQFTRLFRPDNFLGSTETVEGHDRNILAVRTPTPELTDGLEAVA